MEREGNPAVGRGWCYSDPAAEAGFPSKPDCCLNTPSLSLPSAQAGARDLHGYQAGHSSLEAVKDVASGKGHEVVHEGCQGEDE